MPNISFDLLETPYLRDILDQPKAFADTVAELQPIPLLTTLRKELMNGQRLRIVLTGMGGSYQLLYPIHFRLIQAGFDSIMVETSELLYTMPRLLAGENVVIAVSQSGASAEIVRLIERKGASLYLVGVTNTADSPLGRSADLVILTQAGEEAAISCKTAVTALGALEWVGEHLCDCDLKTLHAELSTLPVAFENYLSHWKDHIRALQTLLSGVRSFFAVGRGRSLAAAMLGGMIQKESAHVHGEGISSAGFQHGPLEIVGDEVFVMVYDGDAEVRAMNRSLLRDILSSGGRGALVGSEDTQAPFLLPTVPVRVPPILEHLPPQMVSLALAGLRGRQRSKV
jgi:glucosamine--fructose-6-phosphate aminotransferase (isomerizing)